MRRRRTLMVWMLLVAEHEITDAGLGLDLLDLVGNTVEITGSPHRDAHGAQLLDVIRYRVLQEK